MLKALKACALALLVALLAVCVVAAPSVAKPKPKRATAVSIDGNLESIFGEVSSVKACKRARRVQLFRDGIQIDRMDTAQNGSYSFDTLVNPNSQYQVKAPRKATPKVICKEGVSAAIGGND